VLVLSLLLLLLLLTQYLLSIELPIGEEREPTFKGIVTLSILSFLLSVLLTQYLLSIALKKRNISTGGDNKEDYAKVQKFCSFFLLCILKAF
jgi:hypothetical protein